MDQIPLTLQRRLSLCRTLPTIPAVVLEVLDLCQQEEIAITRVSKVLEKDPALASKVLTVANSAWYGVRSQVTTLDRALALLGINATLSLALSYSFVRGLRKKEHGRFDYPAYWRRSSIAAIATRVVGHYESTATRDELFIAGLLQDIGMMALSEAVPETYRPIVGEANGNHSELIKLERRALGTDHAAVGEWLLQSWDLPEALSAAVGASHRTDRDGMTGDVCFVGSVALGGRIAEIWMHPENAAAAVEARQASIDLLGIQDARFDWILGETAAALPEVSVSLEIDLGTEEEISSLLDRAREAIVALALKAQRQVREFHLRSQSDRLTGLFNRAYIDEIVPAHFLESLRTGQPLSVVFIDIDHFKKINDTHGHPAGDLVLASVAEVLKTTLRSMDIVGRYGGEEFLCVLPNTPESAATLVSERLCAAVASRPHATGAGAPVRVTISAGSATLSQEQPYADSGKLIEAADQRLYSAKTGGRNCAVTPGSDAAPGVFRTA